MELATAVKTLFQATEALARAVEIKSSPEADLKNPPTGSITKSFHWQDPQLETSMSTLSVAANSLLEGQAHPASFLSELASTLSCITGLSSNQLHKDHEAVCMELESAKAQISQLEVTLHKLQEQRDGVEAQMKKQIEKLQMEKAEVVKSLAVVEPQLREACETVDALKQQVSTGLISGQIFLS